MSEQHPGSPPRILLARVYDATARAAPGAVLVDGLWPRGLRRDLLAPATWLPEVAPSRALRARFGHRPDRWSDFRRDYQRELRGRPEAWRPLLEAVRRGPITLLYAARDTERNNAVVLRHFLLRRARGTPGPGGRRAAAGTDA